MAVDEDGGPSGDRLGAGEDDGMAGGTVDFGEEAHADKFLVKPLAASGDIVAAGGVCGDTGEAEEIEKLGELGVHEKEDGGRNWKIEIRNSKKEPRMETDGRRLLSWEARDSGWKSGRYRAKLEGHERLFGESTWEFSEKPVGTTCCGKKF